MLHLLDAYLNQVMLAVIWSVMFLLVWKCFLDGLWCFNATVKSLHAINVVQDVFYWNSLDAVNFYEVGCWK